MASNIDPTKPVLGNPTTQSVRDNFSAAKTEIEALQLETATLETGKQDASPRLDDIAAITPTDGNFIVGDGTNLVAESGATVRASLGLGTIATQDANGVAITGGTITGITDLAVADGGTGASTDSGARANLGVAIGSNVQAWDADLDALSLGIAGQTEEVTPADTDVFLMQRASDGLYRKVLAQNLPGSGSGGGGASSADLRLANVRLSDLSARRIALSAGFADAFVTDEGIDAGSSANFTYDGQKNEVSNLLEAEELTNTLNANGAGWAGLNLRQWFNAGLFATGGSQVRIYFEAPTNGDRTISTPYIGHGAPSGDAFDFEAAPVEATFKGGGTSILVPSGDTFATDLIPFNYNPAKPFLAVWFYSNEDNARRNIGLTAGDYVAYFKSGANESSVTDVTGYTAAAGHLHSINRIEFFDHEAMSLVLVPRGLASQPDALTLHIEAVIGAAVLNTDVIAEVSRDGGTTWTTATLVTVVSLDSETIVYEAVGVDVSAQPSGTSITARISTPNSDAIAVRAVTLEAA